MCGVYSELMVTKSLGRRLKIVNREKLMVNCENLELASARDGGLVGARSGLCDGWRLPTARPEGGRQALKEVR